MGARVRCSVLLGRTFGPEVLKDFRHGPLDMNTVYVSEYATLCKVKGDLLFLFSLRPLRQALQPIRRL